MKNFRQKMNSKIDCGFVVNILLENENIAFERLIIKL